MHLKKLVHSFIFLTVLNFASPIPAYSSDNETSQNEEAAIRSSENEVPSENTSTYPPYPFYFSGFSDESDYCNKLLGWANQVVNGYPELEEECFRKDFFIEKKCLLGGFTGGTYYKPTNVLTIYMRFDNYTDANNAMTTMTSNFSKCEGKTNVFDNGTTGIDYWTEAKVLRELKTQRVIPETGKKHKVKFQLIHKQNSDDYPASEPVGYYVFFESRLD